MSHDRPCQFYKVCIWVKLPPLEEQTKPCPWLALGTCERGSSCRFAHDVAEIRRKPDLYRTSLCPTMAKEGTCPENGTCRFAHDRSELRTTEDLFKTSLCFLFLKNRCTAGNECRYAHGKKELRRKPPERRASSSACCRSTPAPPPPPSPTLTGTPTRRCDTSRSPTGPQQQRAMSETWTFLSSPPAETTAAARRWSLNPIAPQMYSHDSPALGHPGSPAEPALEQLLADMLAELLATNVSSTEAPWSVPSSVSPGKPQPRLEPGPTTFLALECQSPPSVVPGLLKSEEPGATGSPGLLSWAGYGGGGKHDDSETHRMGDRPSSRLSVASTTALTPRVSTPITTRSDFNDAISMFPV